jgi:alkylation response protein AidB-like acyl-CoA dehydrogenase
MTATLDRVRELAPTITARAEEIEAARAVPRDLVDALRAAGAFRMYVPRSHGGDELPPLDVVAVIEELSRADGSVGWITTIGANSPAFFAHLPPDVYDEIYAHGPDVIQAGSLLPAGRAVRTADGYRFTGRWPFASGCEHADLISFSALVQDGDAPPESRFALVPADRVEILDTWYVNGLKGTGSHDITVEDLLVPERWTGSLLAPPTAPHHPLDNVPPLGRLGPELAAVALGIAQGAVDDLVEVGRTKRPLGGLRPRLAEDPLFQHRTGATLTDLRTARLLLHHVARTDWDRACEGVPPDAVSFHERRALLGRVVSLSVAVVDACYSACGTTGLYQSSPLQRRLRDVRAASQHVLFTADPFAMRGAAALGEPVPLSMF